MEPLENEAKTSIFISIQGCAMRRHTRYAISIIFTIILSLLLASHLPAEQRAIKVNPKDKEHRLALLIGNSNYTHGGSLDNPVNDVRAIKRALEALGFTVLKYENCTQKNMKRSMDKFGDKLNVSATKNP